MEIPARNELIDRYYGAVDDADFDRMLTAFTGDVEYRYPGEGTLRGHDEVRAFFTERRETANTTHEVFHRVHGDDATACEGHITGELNGDPFEGDYAGFFGFDDEAGRISAVGVYTQL